MIEVCFAGVTGWTAPPILAGIHAADDLTLTAGVSRSAAGRTLRDTTGLDFAGAVYGSVAEALSSASFSVLVDFTSAAVVRENVDAALEAGVHIVIGTSGLTADDFTDLDAAARANDVGIIASGNFSVMAAVLQQAALMASQHLAAWEVLDYASAGKHDVPSGTARELAETLGAAAPAVGLDELHGPTEARGAAIAGTQVHSIRLPSFVVSTEVVFGGAGERFTLRHDAGESPTPYADGTLLAIRRVAETSGLRRGLATLLFD